MDLIELAQALPSAAAFAEALLAHLDQNLGFEVGHLVRSCDKEHPTTRGQQSARLRTLLVGAERYEPEMVPLRRAALARRGVAVDTQVLGELRWQCSYFRDLAAPLGGQHSLLAFPQLRGESVGILVLGRCSRPWGEREVAMVERVLPTLAVVLSSYGERAAPQPRPLAAERARGNPAHRSAPASLARLTPRERDVLDYLCLGYTNAEIARACGNSPNTVRNQLVSIFGKLGASTRAEAVAYACSVGSAKATRAARCA